MPEAASQGQKFAIVTGASTGIGYELARICAKNGFDLLIVADEPEIHKAAEELKRSGRAVQALEADLATLEGVDKLYAAAAGRPVDALLANAGRGLGRGFVDQDFDDVPNLMEISRNMAGDYPIQARHCDSSKATFDPSVPVQALVHPFNPCLPDVNSRTCQRHPQLGQKYPPFDPDWEPFVLN